MARACARFLLLIVVVSELAFAQLHGHGSGEPPARAFDLGGYVETKFTHYQLNRDSAFYKVEFAGLPQRDNLDYTSAALRLSGNARAGAWQFRFNTLSRLEQDQVSHDTINRFDEFALS